jgi:ABC-type polysaccharide/polyol phosphate export permease
VTTLALAHGREVWGFRHLLVNLVARELKVRYRGSVLGFGWSLLYPLLMIAVFSFVFTVLLKTAPQSVPYPAYLLVGYLPWVFFSASAMGSATSILGNANLVTRIYFPREILTTAIVASNAVNLVLASLVLCPVLIAFGARPTAAWLLWPLVLLTQSLFVLGVGMLVAATNVFFRDTVVILEVVLQAWLFLTPVFYDTSQLGSGPGGIDFAAVIQLVNPMSLYVSLYRSVLLGTGPLSVELFLLALVIGLVALWIGYRTFHSMADRFGDVL